MKSRNALLTAAAVAVLLCALPASSAAGRFLFRNSLGTTAWRVAWGGLDFSSGFGTVTCALTLEGSMHSSTIAKTSGALVGVVTGGSSTGCSPYFSSVLRENLPWHVRYQFFTGTLPNISRIGMEIIGFQWQIREPFFGAACLFTSEAEEPIMLYWSRSLSGAVSSVELAGSMISSDCGISGQFSGTARSITPSMTITLI